MNVCVVNPLHEPGWDLLLQSSDQTTFFHTSAWARVLSESYGYSPLYFIAIDGGLLTGLVAVMDVKSFLTGNRGVSLPFSDECQPIAKDQETFEKLFNELIAFGRRTGWKYIEIRGGDDFLPNAPSSADYCVHTLELGSDEGIVSQRFKSNIRRNINKAEKEGVTVAINRSREAVAAFYRLHCGTRRYHGLPPQPWPSFEKIYEYIILAGKGFVALAEYQKRCIAGAVYTIFRDQAIYKYGASDRNYLSLRGNNLVMWAAIRWCCRNGIRSLNLGRTASGNQGLLQFKRAWGTTEERLEYRKFVFREDMFVERESNSRSYYSIFRVMPIPLLRLVGNLLYRHAS
jgi:hypothetical protein